MLFRQKLWILRLSLPSQAAEAFGEALGEGAVAVTVLNPPRKKTARIEVLYNTKPKAAVLSAQLAVLAAAHKLPEPKFTLCSAPKLDWLKKVAEDFPPLKIARWTVHGAQHRKNVPDRRYALQIDATNAFGTGEHPTTRGCLLMLDKILKAGFCPNTMVDIGCGSGILAMAFAQATGGRAVGVDLDAASAIIAARNIRVNKLGQRVRVCRGSGYAALLVKKSGPYDLIMANIFADPLCEMAEDLKNHLSAGGIAILSGLLKSQAKKVVSAHRKQGLSVIEQKTIGEWAVLALKKPAPRRFVKNKQERLDLPKK